MSMSSIVTSYLGIWPLVSLTHSWIQVLKALSMMYPIRSVTFPCFTRPGILTGASDPELPCLNSMTSTELSTPVTSLKAAVPAISETVTRKFILVNG